MQLERGRTALRQATQAVDELRAAKDSSDLFRDRFPFVMASVQRVGSVIAAETQGHRTPQFGNWWKKTQSDPLFVFMRDVRNAEFKRGEPRQAAHHQVTLTDAASVQDSLIHDGRVVQEGGDRPSEQPAATSAEPSATPPTPHSVDWYFAGGGQYDGQEIFSVVDRYIAWLRDDILPTAERLTR
jgi:hypothetical protein